MSACGAAHSPPAAGAADAVADLPRCSICLCDVADAAVLDSCAHPFCVDCILAWAERDSRCPLCKARIKSVLHGGKTHRVAHVSQQYVWDGVVTAEDAEEIETIVCDICTEGASARRRCGPHQP